MDYLKLFQNHSEYEAFVSGGTMVKPNVSHCVADNEVHYNPWTDPRLIVKYVPLVSFQVIGEEDETNHQNIISNIEPTQLYFYTSAESMTIDGATMFDKVEIDGVEVSIADLDTAQGTYQFATEGEHTVKYTLKDPTIIGAEVDEETGMPTKIGALFVECPVISVNIPNSVTTIGYEVFTNCSSLTSVTIPNSVTSIGARAFTNCSSLTSVTIPNSLTSIGDSAFYRCSGLTSVIIPDSVTSIGSSAFEGCTGLTSVIVKATTPPELVGEPFNVDVDSLKIYVPSESVNAYKTANGWSEYANNIEPIQ